MEKPVSIAIETSCRCGGVALGAGDELIEYVGFDADRRHAVQLVGRLNELLNRHGLRAADLEEVYVSIGPGSFTGLRVGITVARTLGQVVEKIRCAAVPTVEAVAENAASAGLKGHLGVVMDAKDSIYAAVFMANGERAVPECPPGLISVEDFLARAPRPITLLGEGLGYHQISGQDVTVADESFWLPTAEGVWRVGRRMAAAGQFCKFNDLLPLYLRKPEAVRLWEQREVRR